MESAGLTGREPGRKTGTGSDVVVQVVVALMLAAAALLPALDADAQQLVAWPLTQAQSWRILLPGTQVPPRPQPLPQPRPGPIFRPGPAPLPGHPELPAQELSDYRLEGAVEDGAATLTYTLTFHNPTMQRMEGVLMMPLPQGTLVDSFSMTAGGKTQKAELLDAGQAASVYEGIVRQLRDPALLELVGEQALRARVFPIEPNGDVVVRLTLTQRLPRDASGLQTLRVPIQTARAALGSNGRVSARLTLRSQEPLRTLYSPNPSVRFDRRGEKEAVVTLDSSSPADAGDLALYFSAGRDPLAPSLVTFQDEGEDGYFMLSLSPRPESERQAPAPKDVVFVVDRSGSMEEGGKIEQARKALEFCLGRLSARDRFGIVDFATDSQAFEPRLAQATPENKARAKRYVEKIEAAGGTNIQAALADGFKLLGQRSAGRVPMLFFMTDGLPTVGQTDVGELLREAGRQNGVKARLFAFGVGSDVNTLLLDKLADENAGARDYVQPNEDIEAKVSSLYAKVAKPALTDVSLEWKGVEASAVYPRPIRDLFYGSELALVGRFPKAGKGTLVVRGTVGGHERRFEYPLEWRASKKSAFLPKLWASMKIAHELDAIRLTGHSDPEVIAEITKLAKRHGIVTPYTSYLITEDTGRANVAQQEVMMREATARMREEARRSGFDAAVSARAQKSSLFMAAAAPAAPSSVASARGLMAGAGGMGLMAKTAEEEARADLQAEGKSAVELRTVEGKTFYKRGDVWQDGEFELAAGVKPVKVAWLSDDYFALLAREPRAAKWLSLGPKVSFVLGGKAYEVAPER